MTIEEMRKRKQELGYSIRELAQLSGIPEGTLRKVFQGTTKSPRRQTIQALERILIPDGILDPEIYGSPTTWLLQDQPTIYGNTVRMTNGKKQGTYTASDRDLLPEEQRTELIDGVLYDMASPSITHQLILGELYVQLKFCQRQHHLPCRILLAPMDVALDRDDKTRVQPDILVVCNPEYLNNKKNIFGAPDLVIEILSPSTLSKDKGLKYYKYYNAGVREYWTIDPDKKRVVVYRFDLMRKAAVDPAIADAGQKGSSAAADLNKSGTESVSGITTGHSESDDIYDTTVYSFDDTVPVGISNGLCSIDFREISKELGD